MKIKFDLIWVLVGLVLLEFVLNGVLISRYVNRKQDVETNSVEERVEPDYDKALELGGEWFLNNQNDSFIHYEYDPATLVHSTEHHSLREMASLWSIAVLANYYERADFHALAEKGMSYFEEYFEYVEDGEYYYVNMPDGGGKLGSSAFIILALLEMENYPERDKYIEGFAKGIILMQEEDGSFRTIFGIDQAGNQDYYPGEAMFALMSLYEEEGEDRFMAPVEKGFGFYDFYWEGNPSTAFVPWQSRAYGMLYSATSEQKYADFVFEMNNFMLDEHTPAIGCTEFNVQRGVVEGVYIEGVVEAYKVAENLNDEQKKTCYGNYIQESLDYVLTLQVTEESEYSSQEAVGGFKQNVSNPSMRVDRNQHAIFAILGAKETILK